MKFHECFCPQWVLMDSRFPLEILPLSKMPELCATRDGLEGTFCSLCFSQISQRFLGQHPTSRRPPDPLAVGSWSCHRKCGESFASETEKSTPAGHFPSIGPQRATFILEHPIWPHSL